MTFTTGKRRSTKFNTLSRLHDTSQDNESRHDFAASALRPYFASKSTKLRSWCVDGRDEAAVAWQPQSSGASSSVCSSSPGILYRQNMKHADYRRPITKCSLWKIGLIHRSHDHMAHSRSLFLSTTKFIPCQNRPISVLETRCITVWTSLDEIYSAMHFSIPHFQELQQDHLTLTLLSRVAWNCMTWH